ncbi:aspartate aminotransferase family protein [uncultured Shewanella sp.]|uniref:aspartate aminotransferase family protein n=1 Tax=uncultured Shewanella sp. TaxID=173975 RepID=UPI002620EAA9|nr:aspartate aminotransferase family protein [uncultured Shewanella sp.]
MTLQDPQASSKDTLSLENYWMPFTANRQFKAKPRLLTKANGAYYQDSEGRTILDGTAGLWCCNAGHSRNEITHAVTHQIKEMDFAPSFQMGHPLIFQLAQRLASISPKGLNKVFFTNSGSESVDSALKIALNFHRANGEASRNRFIGRELGYHGVGFGGISVGGIPANRKNFSAQLLQGVDHLPHTLDIENNAFCKGLPEKGIEKADALEKIIFLQGAENIAAVIIEPLAGSAGVILPPQGYLKRIREITQKHGILLIFDEVITAFGRVGDSFASERWGVIPDMITTAKGLTNGTVPMGAVLIDDMIYDTCMNAPDDTIELFHGYTYSGHPVAAAAALATLDIYQNDQLFQRSRQLEHYFEEAIHSLKDLKNVIDIRNFGLVGAIQFAPSHAGIGKRAFTIFEDCFYRGALVRVTGDTIALSPPLIIEKDEINNLIGILSDAISHAD